MIDSSQRNPRTAVPERMFISYSTDDGTKIAKSVYDFYTKIGFVVFWSLICWLLFQKSPASFARWEDSYRILMVLSHNQFHIPYFSQPQKRS
jgi:hypothetical protein